MSMGNKEMEKEKNGLMHAPLPCIEEEKRKKFVHPFFILSWPKILEGKGGILLHAWFGRGLERGLAILASRLRYVWGCAMRFMHVFSC